MSLGWAYDKCQGDRLPPWEPAPGLPLERCKGGPFPMSLLYCWDTAWGTGGHMWKKLSRHEASREESQAVTWSPSQKNDSWTLWFLRNWNLFLGNYFELGFWHVQLKECWLNQRLQKEAAAGDGKRDRYWCSLRIKSKDCSSFECHLEAGLCFCAWDISPRPYQVRSQDLAEPFATGLAVLGNAMVRERYSKSSSLILYLMLTSL